MPDPEQLIELPKMKVPQATIDRLRAISDATGAPMTHHRRKALDEYLERMEAGSKS